MPTAVRHTISPGIGTGLALGPAAWFITQQVSYDLASKPCGFVPPTVMLLVNLLGLAVVAVGAWLCWQSWRLPVAAPQPASRTERNFAAGLGFTLCCLFAITIAWQGLATFFYTGCERCTSPGCGRLRPSCFRSWPTRVVPPQAEPASPPSLSAGRWPCCPSA